MNQVEQATKRLHKVLDNIKRMSEEDGDYAIMFSEVLDPVLDNMLNDDAFGSEGQCDPRGDQRNSDFAWSMDRVEGVDA
jgi:hypothetical protein